MKQTKEPPKKHHIFILTDAEKQELRTAFNLFDKNGSGTIEPEEVRVALRVLGYNPSIDELTTIIKGLDKGDEKKGVKNGVDFNEFVQILLAKISEPQSTAHLIRSFNNLDVDMDQEISLDDLTKVTQELGVTLSPEELGEIIMTVRGNASEFDIHTQSYGTITQQDFIAAINKSLEKYLFFKQIWLC